MNHRYRSFSGAVLAVFAIPVFLGLTACLPSLPVPVGDPEKSRIDPHISGIWMSENDTSFMVFEPYDKRTWVITAFDLADDNESCAEEFAASAPTIADDSADAATDFYSSSMAAIEHYGTGCYVVDRAPGAIKAWRTKLGGEWFLTWETIGEFDADRGFEPEAWMVFRIDTSRADFLRLQWVDTNHSSWEKISEMDEGEVTRRDVEKVIRKNADVPDFYLDEPFILRRVQPEHYILIEDFLDESMLD